MKLRNMIAGLLVLSMVGVFSGCEKDQKTLLTDGIWKFKSMTTNSDDETTQDFIFVANALMSGATMEFKSDGTYLTTSPLADEPTSGTWSLIGDDQLILTPEGASVSQPNNIEVLSKSELKYLETGIDLSQNPHTITTSWSR
ncbi:MAG: lipocalin family protein [Bacteroidales bacterium]